MDPIEQIEDHKRRVSEMCKDPVVKGHDALDLLQAVYRNPELPLFTRIKAAMAALPFERPKLQATAVTSLSNESFAKLLERARERTYAAIEARKAEG